MKKIILILMIITLSAGCVANNPSNDKINSFSKNKLSNDELFNKKKECASYKDKMMEDILTSNLVYKDSDPELTEIFYSPKRNSCLYVFQYYRLPICLEADEDAYFKAGCQKKEGQIVDFFTKEIIFSSRAQDNCFLRVEKDENADISPCMNMKSFSDMVDELKN